MNDFLTILLVGTCVILISASFYQTFMIMEYEKELFCMSNNFSYYSDYCSDGLKAYPIIKCLDNPHGYCFQSFKT